ncbi:MAG: phospho-N-acetylmuramoyl-pentapeptide-transferase, partial [Clostridia bacterium]|nr:phospho-N-acetylmuramoyl-pentapeptide-transferase [Clostridia bacterium]
NLTDGLDGLAAGVAVVAALAYVFVCAEFGYAELGVVAAALAGACAGFLAYNRHPARVFMGDTGSLAIGAVLGSLAVLTRTELLLVLIGGIYVWETFSVVSQVLFFRLTGRRLWRMSPYHHHLELGGWSEVKVVRTLWLAGGLLAALAVALMKS